MPQFIRRDHQCQSLSASPFQDKPAGPGTRAGRGRVRKAKEVVLKEFTVQQVLTDDAPEPQNPIGVFAYKVGGALKSQGFYFFFFSVFQHVNAALREGQTHP